MTFLWVALPALLAAAASGGLVANLFVPSQTLPRPKPPSRDADQTELHRVGKPS